MVCKIIFGIFISVLAIFAMSHNASALVSTFDLSNYQIQFSSPVNRLSCSLINDDPINSVLSGQNYCRYQVGNEAKQGFTSIQATNSRNLKAGDIIDFYVVVYTSPNYEGFPEHTLITNQSGQPVNLGWNLVDNGEFQDIDGSLYDQQSPQALSLYVTGYKQYVYNVTQLVGLDGSYNVGLVNSSGIFNSLKADNVGQFVYVRISNINIYRPSETRENKEVEEKTQEAVNESQDSGNDSQSSVEGSTQSLMSAGASIMSALTSAPATDCKISVNTTGSSSVFTSAIGELNLCSNVPSGILNMVQGIVALVFTPIVLYFTYNVITTLYNQFKEYNS